MATNKKRKTTVTTSPSFHRDFREPDENDRAKALGAFPYQGHRSDALWETTPDRDALALKDLDEKFMFEPTAQARIPPPLDALDWLACVPEKGQGLDDYVCGLTSRSGRLRPLADSRGQTIALLPIVSKDDEGTWTGPCLKALAKLTMAFYCRHVEILEPAEITPIHLPSGRGGSTNNNKGKSTIEFYGMKMEGSVRRRSLEKHPIEGRHDAKTNRSQYQVSTILERLGTYRDSLLNCNNNNINDHQHKNFCVMGVTMQDLYDGASDGLFCAGMAHPIHKVAIFSFLRYHPHIRISPLNWWDYGYQKQPGKFSYFEPDAKPDTLSLSGPTSLGRAASIEFLRRSGKLLLHELGHLYALHHCIYYQCLMMGTGHLAEDFAAPLHVCGVCLRKLQWRLGFPVARRYRILASRLEELGLAPEAKWTRRQLRHIETENGNKAKTSSPSITMHGKEEGENAENTAADEQQQHLPENTTAQFAAGRDLSFLNKRRESTKTEKSIKAEKSGGSRLLRSRRGRKFY